MWNMRGLTRKSLGLYPEIQTRFGTNPDQKAGILTLLTQTSRRRFGREDEADG
jgi:hypothetical protein